jgi:hypothetical protein
MEKPDDIYEEFVAKQQADGPAWRKLPLKLLFAAIAIAIIEMPAFSAYLDSTTCVARTGDPSCVSVIEAGIFWQGIAFPLIGLILWLIFRRRN